MAEYSYQWILIIWMAFNSLMDPKLNCYPALFRCCISGFAIHLFWTRRYLFPSISFNLELSFEKCGTEMWLRNSVCEPMFATAGFTVGLCSALPWSFTRRSIGRWISWPTSYLRWHVPVHQYSRGLGRSWGILPFQSQLLLSSFWFQPPDSCVLYCTLFQSPDSAVQF